MVETWRDIDWDEIDTGYTYGTHADDSGQVKDQLKSALFDEYEKVLQMHHDRVQNCGVEGTIASGATPDIGAKLQNVLLVTGVTGITGFVTADAGVTRDLVFQGSLTITDGAALKLYPSGRRNITTAAGDWARVRSRGSGNWEIMRYQRADGFPLTGTIQEIFSSTGAVGTTSNAMNYNDNIRQSSEGGQFLTASITPKYSDSDIVVRGLLQCNSDQADRVITIALFKDSIANALKASTTYADATQPGMHDVAIFHDEASGSTAARTYKLRAGLNGAFQLTVNGDGGVRRHGGGSCSWMSVKEIR